MVFRLISQGGEGKGSSNINYYDGTGQQSESVRLWRSLSTKHINDIQYDFQSH